MDPSGGAGAPGTDRQGMILREPAFAGHGSHHRRLEKFGYLHQFFGSLGVQHSLSGVDQGPRGGQQRRSRPGDCLRVGGGPDHRRYFIVEFDLVQLLGGHVRRYLQKNGPWPASTQFGECPAHQFRHPVGGIDGRRPLGHGFIAPGRIEVGVDPLPVSGHPCRKQQDGDRIGIGLGHAAERVFGARPVLSQENPRLFAVGDPGKPVGHMDPGPLLAADDRTDARYRQGFDEGVSRHTCNEIHSLHLENISYRSNAIHGLSSPGLTDGRGLNQGLHHPRQIIQPRGISNKIFAQ